MIRDTSKIKDTASSEYSNRACLQIYIENRLNQYGFYPQMNPTKYKFYFAVRSLISLRMQINGRKFLTDKELEEAMSIVDQILPRRI